MTLLCCPRVGGRARTPRLLTALAIAGTLSAAPRAQAPSPVVEIDRAEAVWRSVPPTECSITLAVDAFYPGAGRPPTFRVTGDRAEVVGPALEPGVLVVYGRHSTVDGLFDVIRNATSRQPTRQHIEFHPTLGYPLSINIDLRREVSHDEIDGRGETFPVRFGPGQRALFYAFGPRDRPTRRVMVLLDSDGNVVRYSDGRGDLRAPIDPSVSWARRL